MNQSLKSSAPHHLNRWLPRALPSAALALSLALTACGTVREARMVVPPTLSSVQEVSFGRPGWGRKGEFILGAQRVRYERGADRLTLLDALTQGRATLSYTLSTSAGDSYADCSSRQTEVALGRGLTAAQPWALDCRWRGASDASLQIAEQMRLGAAIREGSYRRGDLTLGLRSVHRLEGSPLEQGAPVGYELLREGVVVGSLDLSRGVPHLRRPDPATPLGQAVTEAALALALAWDPS